MNNNNVNIEEIIDTCNKLFYGKKHIKTYMVDKEGTHSYAEIVPIRYMYKQYVESYVSVDFENPEDATAFMDQLIPEDIESLDTAMIYLVLVKMFISSCKNKQAYAEYVINFYPSTMNFTPFLTQKQLWDNLGSRAEEFITNILNVFPELMSVTIFSK